MKTALFVALALYRSINGVMYKTLHTANLVWQYVPLDNQSFYFMQMTRERGTFSINNRNIMIPFLQVQTFSQDVQ